MQKTIRNKVYDTETAQLIDSRASGMYGDPDGYEEKLFQNPEGFLFLYGIGGQSSPYPEPSIRAISKQKAEEWKQAK